MLENVNLKRKLSADEYNSILPGLQLRLYDLEKACWDLKIRSVIIFEGWDAAGKGSAIATVTQRLDPRGFKLHSITAPRSFELTRPWLWRFWLCMPDQGEMAIFDQSWYMRVLQERVEEMVPENDWRAAFSDIVDFERLLADDGVVIVKFFLHIGRKEQEKRFRKIEADPLESWRVTKEDWARHKRYREYLAAYEEMLERTDTAEGSVDHRRGHLPAMGESKDPEHAYRRAGKPAGSECAIERSLRGGSCLRCRSAQSPWNRSPRHWTIWMLENSISRSHCRARSTSRN